MIDKNLILWLPFNDPDGSVAYDFSIRRADAQLSNGATLEKVPVGKALSLNGAGEALSSQVIPFETLISQSTWYWCPLRLPWDGC